MTNAQVNESLEEQAQRIRQNLSDGLEYNHGLTYLLNRIARREVLVGRIGWYSADGMPALNDPSLTVTYLRNGYTVTLVSIPNKLGLTAVTLSYAGKSKADEVHVPQSFENRMDALAYTGLLIWAVD